MFERASGYAVGQGVLGLAKSQITVLCEKVVLFALVFVLPLLNGTAFILMS